jgi:hypothetical protein
MAATSPRKKTVAKVTETPAVNREDFVFTTEAGDTITMPSFATLKPGTIRKARKATDNLDQMFILIENMVPDDETLDILDDLEADEFATFFQEWAEAVGVTSGESTAS